MPEYTRPPNRPDHCAECGASLVNKFDQDLHTEWHAALVQTITTIAYAAEAAAALNRPIG